MAAGAVSVGRVLLALVALSGPAGAQNLTVNSSGGGMTIVGSAFNDTGWVSATAGGGTHPLSVAGYFTTVTAGTGCVATSINSVKCVAASAILVALGDGDDVFVNQSAVSAILDGGGGNDSLSSTTGSGSIIARGGPGNDLIEANGGIAVLVSPFWLNDLDGQDDDDEVVGSPFNDVINGGSGIDVIRARDGNDLVGAKDGAADDTVRCGGGADFAYADMSDPVEGCETVE